MTQATHTSGPWRITTDFIGVYDSEARRIANMDSDGAPDFDEDETIANARLIAAAPDLLAALENMVAQYAYWASQIEMKQIDRDAAAMARAAITKAKGE